MYIERVCYLYATSQANQYITMLNISIPITRMLCYVIIRYVILRYVMSHLCYVTPVLLPVNNGVIFDDQMDNYIIKNLKQTEK